MIFLKRRIFDSAPAYHVQRMVSHLFQRIELVIVEEADRQTETRR
jgi:hypothetical protein